MQFRRQEMGTDDGMTGEEDWRTEADEEWVHQRGDEEELGTARTGSKRDGLNAEASDDEKKQRALEACADSHAALVGCLKQGVFADCSEPQKAFWECYAKHRGVRGNRIAAWFTLPTLSSDRKKS